MTKVIAEIALLNFQTSSEAFSRHENSSLHEALGLEPPILLRCTSHSAASWPATDSDLTAAAFEVSPHPLTSP